MTGLHAFVLFDCALATAFVLWRTRCWERFVPRPGDRGPQSPQGAAGSHPTMPRQAPVRPPDPRLEPFFGRCWVVDGDSLEVDGKRIRMFGLDAPELSQVGGQAAKRHLIALAARRQVRIDPRCIDCYDRIVARVWLGEIDLSDRMVRDGYAVAMTQFSRDYLPAEREARKKRRGRWHADPVNGITDPTEHRRANPRSDARKARNCISRV
jgi:endonuclease YncB( thermonuclease family)